MENKGLKEQVSHGALPCQTSWFLVVVQKQGGFSYVFLPCSSVEVLCLLDKDVPWGGMPGELVRWLGLLWTGEPSPLRLWQHRARPCASARHR